MRRQGYRSVGGTILNVVPGVEPGYVRFMRALYYDDHGKAWLLERKWQAGKLAGERWIRAREYDKKRAS